MRLELVVATAKARFLPPQEAATHAVIIVAAVALRLRGLLHLRVLAHETSEGNLGAFYVSRLSEYRVVS